MGNDPLGHHQRAEVFESLLEIRLMVDSVGKVFGEEMRRRKHEAGPSQTAQKQVLQAAANRIAHKKSAC
jgi:hypothetical protein